MHVLELYGCSRGPAESAATPAIRVASLRAVLVHPASLAAKWIAVALEASLVLPAVQIWSMRTNGAMLRRGVWAVQT